MWPSAGVRCGAGAAAYNGAMPRVLSDGPALATSPDGTLVAVLDRGRLTLVDVAARNEVAEAILPITGSVDLGFADRPARLVTVTRTDGATHVHAFAVPSLEPIAMLEIPAPLKTLAFVGERLLLIGGEGEGESARLVTLTRRSLVADVIALRGPVLVAAAAPEERLLVESRGQLEFWDVALKRALFRLNLPLPPALAAIGFAGKGRLLWVATSSPHGHFEVFRFSDGRRQLQIDLGAPIIAVEGSTATNRILIAQRAEEGAPVTLAQIDLGAREQQALEVPALVGGFAMVEGESPVVVVAATGAPLTFVSLSRATGAARIVSLAAAPVGSVPIDEPAAGRVAAQPSGGAPADATAAEAEKQGASAADRFAAWRSRLHGARAGGPGDAVETDMASSPSGPAPAEVEAVSAPAVEPTTPALERRPTAALEAGSAAARFAARRRAEEGPSSLGASAASPSGLAASRLGGRIAPPRPSEPSVRESSSGTPPQRRWSSSSARPSRPSPTARAADTSAARAAARKPLSTSEAMPGWRAALVAWGRAALAEDGEVDPPSIDGTLIEQLQLRFALEPPSVRLVALLYAAWLLGDGREGLPVARAASLSGDGEDWIEALGRGELAAAGIVRARRGRLRLRAAVGRFLDGQAPRITVVRPAALFAEEPAALSVTVIDGEPLPELAVGLTATLGRPLALLILDGEMGARRIERRLADGLFEARTAGAVALVSGLPIAGDGSGTASGGDAEGWLARLDGGPVVLAVETIAPSIAHLPLLQR